MITELSVENIAVIERATLRLGAGFTVLTGETGAGKSLLVEAIGLALGDRADSDLVRAGATRGRVSVRFQLNPNPEQISALSSEGIDCLDGKLHIEREVTREGRSTTRIQGKVASVGALRKLGEGLVDLHGQHDHQQLLDPLLHLPTYDQWLGEECKSLLAVVDEAHSNWTTAKQNLSMMRRSMRDREQRLDLLRFQLAELDEVAPKQGELADLEHQQSRLRNVEKLQDAARIALESLQRGEANAVDLMAAAVRSLEGAAQLDPDLKQNLDQVRSALYSLQDAAIDLARYEEAIDADPEQLTWVTERMETLQKLMRKHDRDEAGLVSLMEELLRELTLLEDGGASEEALLAKVGETEATLHDAAQKLSEFRKAHAGRFAQQVQAHLHELALERAVFELAFEPKEVDATGVDAVTFRFSANAGEPPRLLSRTASGGELSRVMLALKVVFAGKVGVPTLIFDEIDTGLSGRAAAVVAKKLQELGSFHQVISISHLPQLAGRATSHFRIAKVEADSRTYTEILELSDEDRVTEMARMLAGEEIGDSALANARELLRN